MCTMVGNRHYYSLESECYNYEYMHGLGCRQLLASSLGIHTETERGARYKNLGRNTAYSRTPDIIHSVEGNLYSSIQMRQGHGIDTPIYQFKGFFGSATQVSL